MIRILVAVATVGLFSTAANARTYESPLVREAHRVVDLSDDLESELNKHFRHSSEYRHLINDVYKIRAEAKHIDKLSHDLHGLSDVRYLEADLKDLDGLVHHMGDLLDDIDRRHTRSHTHGDTRHVRSLVASVNRSIHSMERTVAEQRRKFTPRRDDHHRHSHYSRSDRSSVGERIAREVIFEVTRHRRH